MTSPQFIASLMISILLFEVSFDIKEVEAKIKPDKWSKKEILGHLIDSALNNHQRCVRAGYNVADQFPAYDQNEWVHIQQYDKLSWHDLIKLWSDCNQHLCHVIECLPQETKSNLCNIGKEKFKKGIFILEK